MPEELQELVRLQLGYLFCSDLVLQVSRTATAPFDRLKVFLITRPPELVPASNDSASSPQQARAISIAIRQLYREGGVMAFWVGNGEQYFDLSMLVNLELQD